MRWLVVSVVELNRKHQPSCVGPLLRQFWWFARACSCIFFFWHGGLFLGPSLFAHTLISRSLWVVGSWITWSCMCQSRTDACWKAWYSGCGSHLDLWEILQPLLWIQEILREFQGHLDPVCFSTQGRGHQPRRTPLPQFFAVPGLAKPLNFPGQHCFGKANGGFFCPWD